MKVLSLFDGISCGRLALERAGIPVERYVSFEIDPYAIKISQKNYPDIEQRGSVIDADFSEFVGFDMVIGGSPCQDLSSYKAYKHQNLGLMGTKSRLFYEFVRAINIVKPKYFLFENVASMTQENKDIISFELGVEPIFFNSANLCACERPRLYWHNLPSAGAFPVKDEVLSDIVEPASKVPDRFWYDRPFTYNGSDAKVEATLLGKGLMRNMRECYNLNNKCNTLLCDGEGGNRQKKVFQDGRCRKLMPIEYERLQTLPDNYTDCVSNSRRYTAIGNCWTVDVITHLFSGLKF